MRQIVHLLVIGLVLLIGSVQLGAPAAAMSHAQAMAAVSDMADCPSCPDSHHSRMPSAPCPHAEAMLSAPLPFAPALTLRRADLPLELRHGDPPWPAAHEPALDLPPPRS
ncbi:hypothetical protein OE699_10860 [Sedimentimonas flavescens]|uniref:Uncharacterized protein n=1 Tax=Sedimentimonas flavescens TaxID=2851012 RepID=A0ABT3A029_9RHOB|nr:hypothetical protein [Sedimentimonas flavescens]MCV2879357.1 hypothetical protein [Sedimentimonas flavescens]